MIESAILRFFKQASLRGGVILSRHAFRGLLCLPACISPGVWVFSPFRYSRWEILSKAPSHSKLTLNAETHRFAAQTVRLQCQEWSDTLENLSIWNISHGCKYPYARRDAGGQAQQAAESMPGQNHIAALVPHLEMACEPLQKEFVKKM
ncbi:MAG: hypothetical protein Q4C58_01940 [Eubacteriales bacterium]|nr:hypothetical protein [Eubacteriales bacterium]